MTQPRLAQITKQVAGAATAPADTLDARITACLSSPGTSTEITALLRDVKQAYSEASVEREASRDEALDPTTPGDRAAVCRHIAEEAQWRMDRTFVAEKRLEELLARVRNDERVAEAAARRAQLVERRDAMAKELRERYPSIVNELVDLLRRLSEVDDACRTSGIPTSEDVARHGTVYGSPTGTSVRMSRLIDFERRQDPWLWADGKDLGRSTMALPADAPSQAPAPAERYVAVPTLKVTIHNEKRGQPMTFVDSTNATRMLRPGASTAATILEADLEKVRLLFRVDVLGAGEPAKRAA